MQTTNRTRKSLLPRLLAGAIVTSAAIVITGCGVGLTSSSSGPLPSSGTAFQGKVFGGQQPISGSTIQLYAANLTGYGATSYALLTSTVASDGNGNFGITGAYTCPSSTTPVYITATGGNSGSGVNNAIALMAGLGACGNLSSSSFVQINELTTVAAAYALSGFMTSPTQLSTSAGNVTGLNNAFASVNKLVNTATGGVPGSTLPTGATEPIAELNTLADILASCVNSASGSSTTCSMLFTNATPAGGTTPTDTITAMLDIAKNPGHNAGTLFTLASSTAPFQPTLSSTPTDFTVAVKYAPASTFSTPSAAAVDATGNLWVTNAGNNTVAILDAVTAFPSFTSGTPALNVPSGIAFDASGNAWVPSKGSSKLSVFTPAGVGSVTPVVGLSAPTSIAIDGQNLIWITSSGNNSVTAVSATGTSVNTSQTFSGAGVNTPVAVAINPH